MGNIVPHQPSRSLDVLSGIRGSVDEFLSIDNNQRLATPKYMIQMDDLLSSKVENFTEATELYYFDFDLLRTTSGNIGDEQVSSGRVEMSNAVFFISNTKHTPNLIQRMLNGVRVDAITITRLQNIEQKNQPAEIIIFKNCYFQSLVPRFDMLIGDFRYTDYSHDTKSYAQDGTPEGTATANYNLVTSSSDVNDDGGGDEGEGEGGEEGGENEEN